MLKTELSDSTQYLDMLVTIVISLRLLMDKLSILSMKQQTHYMDSSMENVQLNKQAFKAKNPQKMQHLTIQK
jgi:hypothetical protein